jgi:hypothetical protein
MLCLSTESRNYCHSFFSTCHVVHEHQPCRWSCTNPQPPRASPYRKLLCTIRCAVEAINFALCWVVLSVFSFHLFASNLTYWLVDRHCSPCCVDVLQVLPKLGTNQARLNKWSASESSRNTVARSGSLSPTHEIVPQSTIHTASTRNIIQRWSPRYDRPNLRYTRWRFHPQVQTISI